MAKKDVSAAVVEEVQTPVAPVVFGADGNPEDTQAGDTQAGDTPEGSGNTPANPGEKPNVRNGGKKPTGGSVQGANLQTVTTVGAVVDDASVLHKNTIPQENDDKMANRYLQRFLQNGDIRSKDDKTSLYAERMVNEGKQFQPSKAVVKSFPDGPNAGADYLNLLKQQGQFNQPKSQEQPKPQVPSGGE
jgi:hypothetical protein